MYIYSIMKYYWWQFQLLELILSYFFLLKISRKFWNSFCKCCLIHYSVTFTRKMLLTRSTCFASVSCSLFLLIVFIFKHIIFGTKQLAFRKWKKMRDNKDLMAVDKVIHLKNGIFWPTSPFLTPSKTFHYSIYLISSRYITFYWYEKINDFHIIGLLTCQA